MVSGGCLQPRLDTVNFASTMVTTKTNNNKQSAFPFTGLQHQQRKTLRRSDTLHDKEALLYNHRTKSRSPFRRRMRVPDEDDDWGLQPKPSLRHTPRSGVDSGGSSRMVTTAPETTTTATKTEQDHHHHDRQHPSKRKDAIAQHNKDDSHNTMSPTRRRSPTWRKSPKHGGSDNYREDVRPPLSSPTSSVPAPQSIVRSPSRRRRSLEKRRSFSNSKNRLQMDDADSNRWEDRNHDPTTPTERLRKFKHQSLDDEPTTPTTKSGGRKFKHQSLDDEPTTPTTKSGGAGGGAATSRPRSSIRQITAQMKMDDEQRIASSYNPHQKRNRHATGRDDNYRQSPLLFASTREKPSLVRSTGRRLPFESSRYGDDNDEDDEETEARNEGPSYTDERDKKRRQAIAATVYGLEGSHQHRADIAIEDGDGYRNDLIRREDYDLDTRDQPETRTQGRYYERSTDNIEHRNRLDHHIGLATVKADFRMQEKVSDLSSFTVEKTSGSDQMQPKLQHQGPVERAARKMQQALENVKTQIYPEEVPMYMPNREGEDGVSLSLVDEDDLSDGYYYHEESAAMDRRTPRASNHLGRESNAHRLPSETPKRSNTLKGRPQKQMYANSVTTNGNSVRASPKPKSPDAAWAGTTKQSLQMQHHHVPSSNNDDGPEERSRRKSRSSTAAAPVPPPPLQRSSSNDSAGRGGLFLRRARSMTPTKDRSTRQDSQSAGSSIFHRSRTSSRSRPMTPNRLFKSKRNMNESIQLMDLVAEQKLMEIRARRYNSVASSSQGGGESDVFLPEKGRGRSKHTRRELEELRQDSVEEVIRKKQGEHRRQPAFGLEEVPEAPSSRGFPTSRGVHEQRYQAIDQGRRGSYTEVDATVNQERNPTIQSYWRDSKQVEAISQVSYDEWGEEERRGRSRGRDRTLEGSHHRHQSYSRSLSPQHDLQRQGYERMPGSQQRTSTNEVRSISTGKDRDSTSDHGRNASRSTSRGKGLASRWSSIVGSTDGASGRNLHREKKRDAKSSERFRQDMMDFDTLMKAIESDKKNTLGAEFAVVELGDDNHVVQTHAILMNRDDIEDQLRARQPKRWQR